MCPSKMVLSLTCSPHQPAVLPGTTGGLFQLNRRQRAKNVVGVAAAVVYLLQIAESPQSFSPSSVANYPVLEK